VGGGGRRAPGVVGVAVGEGQAAADGIELREVDRVAVAVPDGDVGAGVGLARGDRHPDDRARLVDHVAADHRGAVGRVGQDLLDDRVVLVAEVAGGDRTGGGGRPDPGPVGVAVRGSMKQGSTHA
jgi:hypothetical protein